MDGVRFINLTPHPMTLVAPDGSQVVIPASGMVARVKAASTVVRTVSVDGIEFPINRTVFGSVEGLPEPEEGTIYIVSTLVLSALAGSRSDVVAPDSNSAVRDSDGRIIGVRGFQIL